MKNLILCWQKSPIFSSYCVFEVDCNNWNLVNFNFFQSAQFLFDLCHKATRTCPSLKWLDIGNGVMLTSLNSHAIPGYIRWLFLVAKGTTSLLQMLHFKNLRFRNFFKWLQGWPVRNDVCQAAASWSRVFKSFQNCVFQNLCLSQTAPPRAGSQKGVFRNHLFQMFWFCQTPAPHCRPRVLQKNWLLYFFHSGRNSKSWLCKTYFLAGRLLNNV